LFSGEAAAKDSCTYVAQARLALRMNTGVIAENIARYLFFARRKKREVEARLEFAEESIWGPAFFRA
jgi:cytochrome b